MSFDILLSPPDVGERELDYVADAIRSGWVAPAGPHLDRFEREMAQRLGVPHAVGLSSGTAGLHLALVSLGVKSDDVVIVPTFTFAATVNAVRYVGARPHFIDCDPRTGNLDPDLLEEALDTVTAAGARVPVVIAVDMLGKCADYTRLEAVCAERDVVLLSDAAESLGASHAGRAAGSHGRAAIVSFNGNKIMTTSGGGMLLTADESLAAHVRKLSTQAREPVAHYEHREVGFNYRLSNILAALGLAQLERLDSMMKRRREWRTRYTELFTDVVGVSVLGADNDHEDNCWLTAVVIDPAQAPVTAADLGGALATAGIETRPLWKPMHLQPVYSDFAGTLTGAAEMLFRDGLTLPSGSGMTDEQFTRVAEAITAKVTS